MALDLEMHRKIRNKNNTFALENGMEVTELKVGYAVAKMDVTPRHYNPLDTVHGGCISTLADVAASYAACSRGTWMTTLDCNLQYVRPAVNTKTLYATATEVHAGKKITIIAVSVTDQDNREIARSTITFMNLGEPIPDLQDENANFIVKNYEKKPEK